MHLHILGICGTFMGGVAAIAAGGRPSRHRLRCERLSADVDAARSARHPADAGYGAEQLQTVARDADVFVIGNVVSRGNPLMEASSARGARTCRTAMAVRERAARQMGAGGRGHAWQDDDRGRCSHGFSTVPAWRPRSSSAALPADFGVSARRTDSAFFVIEADEYDTAFFDKRSKFVHYRPRTVVLNNLEFDHADIFPDLAAIETQFITCWRTVRRAGERSSTAARGEPLRVLARGCWSEIERFGFAEVPQHPFRLGRSPSTGRFSKGALRKAR